jgi:hypothetical protein
MYLHYPLKKVTVGMECEGYQTNVGLVKIITIIIIIIIDCEERDNTDHRS